MAYGPKNLKISYSSQSLTHFGGLWLIQQFLRRLNLRWRLQKYVGFPQRNNHYSASEMFLALIYPMILGLGRLEATHLLRQNGVFRYLTGLPRYPNPTSLRRFLMRISPETLRRLRRFHETLLKEMVVRPSLPTSLVFDLDSTVLTVYGRLEGAKIGYNPFKKGRPSYHPLLCFDGIRGDCWEGEFRAGNVHTGLGALDLLKRVFSKIPPEVRSVRIRADVGFYGHEVIEWLEEKRAGYCIVAKITPPLQGRLGSLRYRKAGSSLAFASFSYQPINWEKPHRFVVVRKPLADLISPQLSLFTLGSFTYHVYVTNLELEPINLWRFYNGRAGVELIIKELKHDYFLTKIPTRSFAANEAYFHLLLLSYNLISWFKRFCLPPEFHNKTLHTLRPDLLLIPAELTHTDNRPVLKLPGYMIQRKLFDSTLKKLKTLNMRN